MDAPINDVIRKRLLSNLHLMIGVSEADHWLRLKKEPREAVKRGIEVLGCIEVAECIRLSTETIEKWKTQIEYLSELKFRLESNRTSKGRIKFGIIRPELCSLARDCPVRHVSEVLGVPKSTLQLWLKDSIEQTAITNNALIPSETVESTVSDLSHEMKQNLDAQRLAELIKRHEGKPRKKYSPLEKSLLVKLLSQYGSKAVHDSFKVSYDTIARLKRQKIQGEEKRARVPLRYLPVVELMRKHPGMGPMQIRDYIKRHLGLSMGVGSIRRVMEQNGWVPPFARVKRISQNQSLYEAVRRNYLWHIDFKHHYINKCKVYVMLIQDDHSRFITGHILTDGEKVDAVLTAVDEAIMIHGRPDCIMSDGGSAFFSWRGVSQFTRYLEEHGIEQIIAQTPNANGKIENLNQQLEKELLLTTTFASLTHLKNELSNWIGFYNFSRPHQGLAGVQVPADRFFPGAKQWYGENSEKVKQQSLIAETMASLLQELQRKK